MGQWQEGGDGGPAEAAFQRAWWAPGRHALLNQLACRCAHFRAATPFTSPQELVEKISHKAPNVTVNPDEVVALGAAVQGGVLAGEVSGCGAGARGEVWELVCVLETKNRATLLVQFWCLPWLCVKCLPAGSLHHSHPWVTPRSPAP